MLHWGSFRFMTLPRFQNYKLSFICPEYMLVLTITEYNNTKLDTSFIILWYL